MMMKMMNSVSNIRKIVQNDALPRSPASFRKSTLLLVPALLAALAGCARIPLEHEVPAKIDAARVQLAPDIRLARDGWPQAQWWQAYRDPQLNRLIAQALREAPTLAAAQARLATARATWAADRAEAGGAVDLDTGFNRQRYSSNGFFPSPIGGSYYNDASLQVVGNYDLDWWGRHRAQIAAAVGEVNARSAEYAQTEQTLAAAITQSYFNLQSGWARLANLKKLTAIQDSLMADRARRIAQGLATGDEHSAAMLDLANLRRQNALLESSTRRERETLRALLGQGAEALADLRPQAPAALEHALPASLGLDLLARRADLQAARWRVEASLSRIEASEAAFYPDINLRAAFGLDAVSLGTLLKRASRTPFVGSTLSLPLFDSGRLQAGLGLARAERNAMLADYNQAVIDALRDVAQDGIALQGIEDQIRQQGAANRASQAMLGRARARLAHGLGDRASVLAAELALLRQQDIDLQLQNTQMLAEVALSTALGGGYWADAQGAGAVALPQN